MENIADVIENSAFVIMCMSDSYKRCNHCRSEAEYALNTQRSLVSLILRPGFKPDDWLISLIDNSTYVDFGTSDFKSAA